jgi:hypothetical protein
MKPFELKIRNSMAGIKDTSKWENRNCIECSITFEVYKKSKKIYCSKKCSNNSKSLIDIKNTTTKQTIEDKYGGIHYMNNKNTQLKHTRTMIDRYGVEHALQNGDIMKSMKKTCLDRYGVDNVSKHDVFIDKIKKTKLELYGDENYHNVDKLHDNVYNKFLSWNHITPLFDRKEFVGVNNKKYKFKCNDCNRILDVNTDNGYIPSCKVCNTHTVSSGELELYKFIESIYDGNIITNDKSILNGKEIDIYLPDINLAIEFNGIYWHSELRGDKNKYYHLNKTEMCKKMDIKLIHIFEHEWLYKKDIIKSMVTSLIGNNNKIYARKCEIRNIDVDIKNKFLSKYHIQSGGRSSIKLGLFYENTLMSVMTFGKSRFDKKYKWEIIRFASKSNFTIIGGASKLLKYFIKIYNPKSIVTYSDRRFGDGDVYEKIGFNFIKSTHPSYYYVKGLNVYSRFQFQKHKLRLKLNEYNDNLSEWENMIQNGYDRLWDCGHNKYEMKC